MTQILTTTKPKLGFVGVGWIGKNRLQRIRDSKIARTIAAADPDTDLIKELCAEMPEIQQYGSYCDMLDSDLDGIVIATPSAMHAEQAIAALKQGKAVFCQKPLGRNAEEAAKVVQTARKADRLLQVDFSYRYTKAMRKVKEVIQSGDLGSIYGIELTFHNAYGPDKAWYRNRNLSGGGCLMDLGIHLIDLLYWILDEPEITDVQCRLLSEGMPLKANQLQVEDYAVAQFTINGNTAVQLSCSWNLPAGTDAVIEAGFYGEQGGVAFHNIGGSFYDFVTERYEGTASEVLVKPPDTWSGRAAVEWAEQLSEDKTYDPAAEDYIKASQTLDHLYHSSLS